MNQLLIPHPCAPSKINMLPPPSGASKVIQPQNYPAARFHKKKRYFNFLTTHEFPLGPSAKPRRNLNIKFTHFCLGAKEHSLEIQSYNFNATTNLWFQVSTGLFKVLTNPSMIPFLVPTGLFWFFTSKPPAHALVPEAGHCPLQWIPLSFLQWHKPLTPSTFPVSL